MSRYAAFHLTQTNSLFRDFCVFYSYVFVIITITRVVKFPEI